MKAKPKIWLEIKLRATATVAEVFADYFYQLTGNGVQMSEPEPSEGLVQVTGYLDPGGPVGDLRLELEEFLNRLAPNLVPQWGDLPEEDWARAWMENFHPKEVAPGLVVAPPWERPQAEAGQRVLVIDPGQAFGTGQHESTILCLRRITTLAANGRLPQRVLDLGCGSGVLALAALLFGAEGALCLDIDPLALEATQANARLNGLSDVLQLAATPMSQVRDRFPLIMANLTAGDILDLAPDLAARLAPGGELVASGILIDQLDQVRTGLQEQGLNPAGQDTMGEWGSLVMTCT